MWLIGSHVVAVLTLTYSQTFWHIVYTLANKWLIDKTVQIQSLSGSHELTLPAIGEKIASSVTDLYRRTKITGENPFLSSPDSFHEKEISSLTNVYLTIISPAMKMFVAVD